MEEYEEKIDGVQAAASLMGGCLEVVHGQEILHSLKVTHVPLYYSHEQIKKPEKRQGANSIINDEDGGLDSTLD